MLASRSAEHSEPRLTLRCDKCRARDSGELPDFSELARSLTFDPVPRKTARADGWTPDRQRLFILALAATGSPRKAANAVGMAGFGAERLRHQDGAETFNLAWDRAMTLAENERTQDAVTTLKAIRELPPRRRGGAAPFRPSCAPPTLPSQPRLRIQVSSGSAPDGNEGPGDFDDTADYDETPIDPEVDAAGKRLLALYATKLVHERDYRMKGEIIAADFTLRQASWIEVVIECGSATGLVAMLDATRFGPGLLSIVDTPSSRFLESIRRKHWELMGEPERPAPIADDLTIDQGDYRIAVSENDVTGIADLAAHDARLDARHAADAAKQIAWENRAIADWEAARKAQGSKRSADS